MKIGDFIPFGNYAGAAFTPEEFARIPAVTVEYPVIYITLHSFFRDTGQVENRVFLLSQEEVSRYLPEKKERLGYGAHARYVYNAVHQEKLLGPQMGTAAVWAKDVGVRPAIWYQP